MDWIAEVRYPEASQYMEYAVRVSPPERHAPMVRRRTGDEVCRHLPGFRKGGHRIGPGACQRLGHPPGRREYRRATDDRRSCGIAAHGDASRATGTITDP